MTTQSLDGKYPDLAQRLADKHEHKGYGSIEDLASALAELNMTDDEIEAELAEMDKEYRVERETTERVQEQGGLVRPGQKVEYDENIGHMRFVYPKGSSDKASLDPKVDIAQGKEIAKSSYADKPIEHSLSR